MTEILSKRNIDKVVSIQASTSTYFQNLRYQGQLREAECGYEEEQRQRQEVVAKNPTLIFKHPQFPISRCRFTKILLATIKNHSSPPRWWKEQVWLSVVPTPLQVILFWLSSSIIYCFLTGWTD